MMLGAGLCNAIAFYCLSWSLKLLPVIYVNAINVSQVAMAGAIGVLLFFEPLSVWLSTGLVIMIIGFGMLAHFSSKTTDRRDRLNSPMEMDAWKAK
jgi:drug/metabolite transporter (DMT)-like permease